ncbi:MAG: capsular polysaccharide export protein [Celeribacter sp.]|jgi:capsular polysaccharide export protein
MQFLKLDTKTVSSFDDILGDTVRVVSTGFGPCLKLLKTHLGAKRAYALMFKSFVTPSPHAADNISGNIYRKQIRFPKVFGNPIIRGLYRYFKLVDATMLEAALRAEMTHTDPEITIVYNGTNYPESVLNLVTEGRKRVFLEAGFFPRTLQFDPVGLNGANSVPRDPKFYLDTDQDFAAEGLPDLVNDRASKTQFDATELPKDFIFVPFQVPSDMQVTRHSPWVKDMETFLDVICDAAERNPTEVFVIKEHPSFKRSVIGLRTHPRVIFANGNVTSKMIQQARAVITLNSTVGIEALLFDTDVITLGRACYNIDGLVQHATGPQDLDDALAALRSKTWTVDTKLRQQFLGYLHNRYLVSGTFWEPPTDLAAQILKRAQ